MVSSKSQIALRKAAILVSSLDHRTADSLLDRMMPDLASRVRDAVVRLGDVSDDEVSEVMREFLRSGGGATPGDDAGVELDSSLARRISSGSETLPEADRADASRHTHFQSLRLVATESLAQHLKHEHPQIVAVVLAHLPPARSAEVIKHLPERLQVDVLRRVAELDRADPQVLRDLEIELEQRLAGEIRAAKNRSAGLSAVASILDAAGSDRDVIVRTVLRHDEQLSSLLRVESESRSAIRSHAGAARDEPSRDEQEEDGDTPGSEPAEEAARSTAPRVQFPFEDLELLDDRGLAAVFATAEPEVTLVALSGADESLVSRITAQLPPRQGRQLRKSIKRLGPLRLSDIEHAQREIARLASQMVAEGTIDVPAPRRWVAAA